MNTLLSIVNALLQNLGAHWQIYSAAATALFVAAVCCMPATRPRSLDEWWTWLRDSLQTAVPAARHRENPIPPADPAQTQK